MYHTSLNLKSCEILYFSLIFEQFIFRLESGIWVLTADFWKNLFMFCHRNSRSELRRTPKSTIMKFSVLSVPRSCASLLLFQSAQFFQKRYSYVVTSVNKKSQKSNPRSQIPDSRRKMNCSIEYSLLWIKRALILYQNEQD